MCKNKNQQHATKRDLDLYFQNIILFFFVHFYFQVITDYKGGQFSGWFVKMYAQLALVSNNALFLQVRFLLLKLNRYIVCSNVNMAPINFLFLVATFWSSNYLSNSLIFHNSSMKQSDNWLGY
jgi:hypothetical protein